MDRMPGSGNLCGKTFRFNNTEAYVGAEATCQSERAGGAAC